MIGHITSYLYNHVEHHTLHRSLVVDKLTYLYNSKSSPNFSANPFERQERFSLLSLLSTPPFHYASDLLSKTC